MVIWLIGLAGAGKTSVGRELHALLRGRNPATVFLDGDAIRRIMGDNLGHSMADREQNGWRICRMCEYLEQQDFDVIAAILSNFPEQQAWNRQHFSRYFEVFLKVSENRLFERDQKGLYSAARAGRISNVVGVDLPFCPPRNPDLVLRNDEPRGNLRPLAEAIVAALDA